MSQEHHGLREQIASASSVQQIGDLLNRLRKFHTANPRTVRACESTARRREQFLLTQKNTKNKNDNETSRGSRAGSAR